MEINAAATDITFIALFRNGSEVKRFPGLAVNGTMGYVTLPISVETKCAAGDTLDVRVYSNNASPAVQTATTVNWVQVERVYGS